MYDDMQCAWTAHDDLAAPYALSEHQRATVIDAVAQSVDLDCVDRFAILAVVTFDSATDTDPEIDYRVDRDGTEDVDLDFSNGDDENDESEITVDESDDCVVVDKTNSTQATLDELLEDSDIIDADA